MSLPSFTIDNVDVPIHAIHDFHQTYEDFGGYGVLRRLNGSGIGQENWRKLRTVVTGSGAIPPGFAGLSPSTPYLVGCGATRSVGSSGVSVVLPAGRRSGANYALKGFAWVPGDGMYDLVDGLVPADILSVVGNVVTLSEVEGAQSYFVTYYPQITAFVSISETSDVRKAERSWELTAEEV